MGDRVKQTVRYWGFLVLKLALSCAIAGVLLCEINYSWTPKFPIPEINWAMFFWDKLYAVLTTFLFLFWVGMLYLSVLDQRYRCRVCLRRLRMPVEKGSWSRMLQFGRPQTEYICIYGHGTLNVPELQISGLENSEWKEQGDIWDELFAGDPDKKR
jgi:hypothetical protein